MNTDLFHQRIKKNKIKHALETYTHQNIDSDLENILFKAKNLLSINSQWKGITYQKGYIEQKRTIDVDSKGRNIAHILYGELVVPFIMKKLIQLPEINTDNIEHIFLYGSLASFDVAQYTSDIDLNVSVKDELSQEQFDKLSEAVFDVVTPLAEALDRNPSDLIQVNYKSKTGNPTYISSFKLLWGFTVVEEETCKKDYICTNLNRTNIQQDPYSPNIMNSKPDYSLSQVLLSAFFSYETYFSEPTKAQNPKI